MGKITAIVNTSHLIYRTKPTNRYGLFLSDFAYVLLTLVAVTLSFRMLVGPFQPPIYDFAQIIWHPARQIIEHGSVAPGYPYPLWTPLLFLPFGLGTLEFGAILWLWFSLCCIAVATVSLMRVLHWPRLLAPVLGIAMVNQDRLVVGLLAGQVVIVVLLALVLLLWAVQKQRLFTTGALLAFALIKPHLVFLLTIGFLSWAVWYKQWRILGGYATIAFLLVAVSLPFAQSPLQVFGGGIPYHLQHGMHVASTLWGLGLHIAPRQLWLPAALCTLLLLWLVRVWYRVIRCNSLSSRALEIVAVTTVVNILILPYSWSYNLTLLVIPVSYLIDYYWKAGGIIRYAGPVLLYLLLYPAMQRVGPLLFDVPQNEFFYAVIPLLILILLLAAYRNATRTSCDKTVR
jgi:hypothetical protein